MLESNMLLIVPADWVELDANFIIDQGYDPINLAAWIADSNWGELAGLLENLAIPIPVGQMIFDAKIFDDGSGYRLWVRLTTEV
jgi:hypothetical protein